MKLPAGYLDPAALRVPELERVGDRRWISRDLPDPDRAGRMETFIESLTVTTGPRAGRRIELTPWQRYFVRQVYGRTVIDAGTVRKQYQTVVLWCPRGTGKTTWAGALTNGHLVGPEGGPRRSLYHVASTQKQARICFDDAWHFASHNPLIFEHVRDRKSTLEIESVGRRSGGSVLQAISSVPSGAHGFRVDLAVCDEVHAWHRLSGGDLYDTVTEAAAKVTDGLIVVCSTVGEGTEGAGWELWEYSLAVARGEVEDASWLPLIFGAPEDAPWDDPRVWHAVHPGLQSGMVFEHHLQSLASRAAGSPDGRRRFRQRWLNIWQHGMGAGWIEMEAWNRQPAPPPLAEFAGRDIWVGIDLSSTTDLTAMAAVVLDFNADGERVWHIWVHHWVPRDSISLRARRDRALYEAWAEDGRYLTATPGEVVDYGYPERHLLELAAVGRVRAHQDQYNIIDFQSRMQPHRIEIVKAGMSFIHMTAAVKEMRRAAGNNQLCHEADPVLAYCAGNGRTKTDPHENEMFQKNKSAGRIDGLVAVAVAIGAALRHGHQKPRPSRRVWSL